MIRGGTTSNRILLHGVGGGELLQIHCYRAFANSVNLGVFKKQHELYPPLMIPTAKILGFRSRDKCRFLSHTPRCERSKKKMTAIETVFQECSPLECSNIFFSFISFYHSFIQSFKPFLLSNSLEWLFFHSHYLFFYSFTFISTSSKEMRSTLPFRQSLLF